MGQREKEVNVTDAMAGKTPLTRLFILSNIPVPYAMAGTGLFAGIMSYFVYERRKFASEHPQELAEIESHREDKYKPNT